MWAWFTEMDLQSISNGPGVELARVEWEMSDYFNLSAVSHGVSEIGGGLERGWTGPRDSRPIAGTRNRALPPAVDERAGANR
jgi:hypothetical protein